ncbi:hypothetical protein KR067_005800 [Drosophila pandora]|nr:hypothetical protein KR067_005800 [Drosophila pandora]
MAQPENTLNESNLAEARGQLKDVPPFRGEPETLFTFISRVDYILSLYHTNDVRQQRILLGAIERNIEGHVTRTLGLPTIEDWPTLRSRMISEYKPQAPNYKLLENFRETPYKGNLRAFCEEAERRRQILISKLHLEEYYDYTQYQDQTYEEQCQAPLNQDQAEINFDENFQSPAPEDTNT